MVSILLKKWFPQNPLIIFPSSWSLLYFLNLLYSILNLSYFHSILSTSPLIFSSLLLYEYTLGQRSHTSRLHQRRETSRDDVDVTQDQPSAAASRFPMKESCGSGKVTKGWFTSRFLFFWWWTRESWGNYFLFFNRRLLKEKKEGH